MRRIVFRVLAGLLSVAVASLLAFGDTSKMSLRELIGIGVVGAGFGLHALFGSGLGERIIWLVFGGRDTRGEDATPGDRLAEEVAAPERRGM